MPTSFAAGAMRDAPTVPSVARLFTQNSEEPTTARRYPIKFTGSGKTYFRIWIVNLLLTLASFGLYYPWAKVRKLRYLYGNTSIANHAVQFHGNPKRMLRGYLLMALLMAAYSGANRLSEQTGAIAGFILAALWPALLHASLQFKLANTSWHGLRFRFTGSLVGAYKVFLKPIGITLGVVVLTAILTLMFGPKSVSAMGTIVLAALVTTGYLMVPYTWWRLKKYQHGHYALAQCQTGFRVTFRPFLGVFVKSGMVALGSLLIACAVFGIMLGVGWVSLPAYQSAKPATAMSALMPVLILFVVASQVVPGPFFVSRMQNLVWTNTGNQWIRFKSNLGFKTMLGLTVKNGLLMLVTLGLYWPFATIATIKAKLSAMTVHTRISPDQLISQAERTYQDASGDAAGDLLGIDVGL